MKEGKGSTRATLVEVIPIVRGITKDSLTYFSTSEIALGTFVRIPVRKGVAEGVVTYVEDASSAKSSIKGASFALRKIGKDDVLDARLGFSFVRAAQKTAQFYAVSVGSILGALLPTFLLEDPKLLSVEEVEEEERGSTPRPPVEPLVVQLESNERFAQYMSLIRQSFAKNNSVLFIAPTAEEAKRAFKVLSRGISEYSYLFTKDKRMKELKTLLKEAKENSHPVLFITTHIGAAFDRKDLSVIILEKENSRSYRMQKRPYMHLKTFLIYFAKETGKQLVLGDSVLSVETLYKEKESRYGELAPIKWRLVTDSRTSIIDMKGGLKNSRGFEVFSSDLKYLIQRALNEEKKIVLFGVRKGLAPSTTCGDCGTILACKNCRAPVVLHNANSDEKRIYICHACGDKRSATTTCEVCGSWKLVPLGIGVDKIEEEVNRIFPEANTFVLDKDHVPTEKSAKKMVEEFETTDNAIMIGTEMILNHIESVPFIAVISLDSLFSIPDFSINERVFYLVSRLREMTQEEMIIQTRNIGKAIITWAAGGNVADFYRNEIEERQMLMYPPFALFIKVSIEDVRKEITEKKNHLMEKFGKWQPEFLEKRGQRPGTVALSMILRVKREEWPKPELTRELTLLTPDFLIKVDPDTIL